MCGINGIIFKNSKVDKRKILAMNELLKHRGPDQSGYICHNSFLLGHTRLSILDISEKGSQPMTTDGRYWIAYNGEVYNFRDLRKELINKDYKFFSETDTEVVLNSYKEYGTDFPGQLIIIITVIIFLESYKRFSQFDNFEQKLNLLNLKK